MLPAFFREFLHRRWLLNCFANILTPRRFWNCISYKSSRVHSQPVFCWDLHRCLTCRRPTNVRSLVTTELQAVKLIQNKLSLMFLLFLVNKIATMCDYTIIVLRVIFIVCLYMHPNRKVQYAEAGVLFSTWYKNFRVIIIKHNSIFFVPITYLSSDTIVEFCFIASVRPSVFSLKWKKLKYLETNITDQNNIHGEIMSKSNSRNACCHSIHNNLLSCLLSKNL